MWKDFKRILKKRTKVKVKFKNDKHLLIKASELVLNEIFGEISGKFIKVDNYKENKIYIKVENSIWGSELKLNNKKITQKINQKINQDLIKTIIIIK